MHLSCSSRSDEDKEDEEDSNRSIIIFGKRFVGRIVFVLVTQDDEYVSYTILMMSVGVVAYNDTMIYD